MSASSCRRSRSNTYYVSRVHCPVRLVVLDGECVEPSCTGAQNVLSKMSTTSRLSCQRSLCRHRKAYCLHRPRRRFIAYMVLNLLQYRAVASIITLPLMEKVYGAPQSVVHALHGFTDTKDCRYADHTYTQKHDVGCLIDLTYGYNCVFYSFMLLLYCNWRARFVDRSPKMDIFVNGCFVLLRLL